MRILNEEGVEINPEDVDLSLGYLKEEEIVVDSHEEQHHYSVGNFYFKDNTSYHVESENDPHLEVIDAETGIFKYVPQEGEEEKEIRGMDIILIIDQEAGVDTEIIQRYILYTEEELIQRSLPERMDNAEETLQETSEEVENLVQNELPTRMEEAENAIQETGMNVEDLILLFAEVLGGEEIPEEEEEEPIEPEPSEDESIEPEPSEDESIEPELSEDENIEPSPDDVEPTEDNIEPIEDIVEEGEE